jgi:hypothetical protein
MNRIFGRGAGFLVVTSGFALAAVAACTVSTPATSVVPDASTPSVDASTPEVDSSTVDSSNDAGTTDAAVDSATTDASDGAPPPVTFTTSFGPAGYFDVSSQPGQDYVQAAFRTDEQIVRSSVSPCIVELGSQPPSKPPFASAGTLTVGGPAAVHDGGLASPFELAYADDEYLDSPGVFLDYKSGANLLISIEGTPFVPALAPTALKMTTITSAAPVAIIVPVKMKDSPDAQSTLTVSGAAGLPIKWTPPLGDLGEQKMILTMFNLKGESSPLTGRMSCAFPLGAGSATIPSEVLVDLKKRLGGSVSGVINLRAGAYGVFGTDATYVVVVADDGSTTFAPERDVLLTIK